MRRYVQAFFRHPLLLSLPVVLALAVSVGLQLQQPPSFQAAVSMWADTPVPNQSSIFSSGPSDQPAFSQAVVLRELLQTRAFLTRVGQGSPWATFLADHPGPDGDGVLFGMAKNIAVATPGPHILAISTAGPTSNDAVALAKATADAYIAEVNESQSLRAKASGVFYKAQVDEAAKTLAAAQDKLTQYLNANQGSGPLGAAIDSTVAQLKQAVTAAQDNFDKASSNSATAGIGASNLADSGVLRIFDPPRAGSQVSHKKKLIFSGVTGLFGGATVSTVCLLFLVLTDRSVQGSTEIEDLLGMQVVGTIDEFRTKVRPWKLVS